MSQKQVITSRFAASKVFGLALILVISPLIGCDDSSSSSQPVEEQSKGEEAATPLIALNPSAELEQLIKDGDVSKVSEWLKRHPDVIDKPLGSSSALEILCRFGNAEMLDAYVAAGGSLKWRRDGGEPIMYYATWFARPAVLPGLIDRLSKAGVSANEMCEMGNTLHAMQANVFLMPGVAPDDVRTKILDLLIGAGADVNAVAPYGRSPLHVAARWGDAFLSEELLKRGANVNQPARRAPGTADFDSTMTPLRVVREGRAKAKPNQHAKLDQVIELLQRHGGR